MIKLNPCFSSLFRFMYKYTYEILTILVVSTIVAFGVSLYIFEYVLDQMTTNINYNCISI